MSTEEHLREAGMSYLANDPLKLAVARRKRLEELLAKQQAYQESLAQKRQHMAASPQSGESVGAVSRSRSFSWLKSGGSALVYLVVTVWALIVFAGLLDVGAALWEWAHRELWRPWWSDWRGAVWFFCTGVGVLVLILRAADRRRKARDLEATVAHLCERELERFRERRD